MLTKRISPSALSMNCILVRTAHCSVRPQGEQYLIYNTKTDELHLISPLASYVIQLCDGLNTVGDLTEMFSNGSSTAEQIATDLHDFFVLLLERGVVEIAQS